MRLVIDLQAAQGCNKDRGIGRYALALAQALTGQATGNEVWIALNDAFPDTIEPLRAAFDTLLPQERIVVWQAPGPTAGAAPSNDWRRNAAELLRESFLESLEPDLVYVPSLFEGIVDDAATSVGRIVEGRRTGVAIHDLIPLADRDRYLADPAVEAAYQRKLVSIRRAGLWCPVSEWTRREAMEQLGLPGDKLIVVPNAADRRFCPMEIGGDRAESLLRRFGITRPFVMYTAGTDPRKNIERLVGAFARLPRGLCGGHQLVVVCAADAASVRTLKELAARRGLAGDGLILTGFVSDDDLVKLYNLCRAFCFPSLSEGFGLPALEAMQCGAPTIGANVAGIPEVIGRVDALFDPSNEEELCALLTQVLVDENFRTSLVMHGREQARKFSWQDSAAHAWAAFAAQRRETPRRGGRQLSSPAGGRPRLAYVSPLPPEKSGISDYSVELLPELARHYDIDVVVSAPPVAKPSVSANYPQRTVAWFAANANAYDRILYHLGNSVFHRHMFDLAERYPGIVVLHDVYLSGIIAHMDQHDGRTGYWAQSLYESHGYQAVQDLQRAADSSEIIWKYPANLSLLQHAAGVIVHSEFARTLAAQHYGREFVADWAVVPQLLRLPPELPRQSARAALGFGERDFIVCSVGVMGPAKLNHRLLAAWLDSDIARRDDCHLVFVGQDPDGRYAARLSRMIAESACAERVRMAGFAAPAVYRQYLSAADVAVQLRSLSRGETSRSALECMASRVPTIINAHGATAELPKDCVIMLPDQFSDAQLMAAIERVRDDPGLGGRLGAKARAYIADFHSPREVADLYHAAIEGFAALGREMLKARTLRALVELEPAPADEREWLCLARAVHHDMPPRRPERQLLVDVSELVLRDVGSGVQRVVRSVLGELFSSPPTGYRIEPVYATEESNGYRYARQFALRFMGCETAGLADAPVDCRQGDLFLGLDLQPHVVPRQTASYAEMRREGVGIYFVVHDLLPILMPRFFAPGAAAIHERWLAAVTSFADGLICVSRTVADEVISWLEGHGTTRARPLRIGWIHHGADLKPLVPHGRTRDGEKVLPATFGPRPSFLMVGTVEPRKGHAQTLAAFEQLWAAGVEASLVIVGREGWMVERLTRRLRTHRELGRRLFWLEDLGDEALAEIYASATCLIAASEGEGFGLPLVEAAQFGLPILARDIPVFREVGGRHAHFFRAGTAGELAQAIREWLAAFAAGIYERSDQLPRLTWAEACGRLETLLLGDGWYAQWPPKAPAGCVSAEYVRLA